METKRTLIGIFILLLVATFNVLAEQTSKSLVGALSAPFFIQYFSTAWLIALCPIYTVYAIVLNLISSRSWNENLVPDLGPIGLKGDFKIIQLRYCLLFMLIYVGCNAIYVAALKFIPNMVASAVMSLDPAIVFVLSLLFLNNWSLGIPKNIQQFISALIAVGGVWLLVYGAPDPDDSEEEVPINKTGVSIFEAESNENDDGDKYGLGIILVCIAAFLSGLYKISYKYFFDTLNLGQCCYSLAIIGLLDLILLWPISLILFATDVETANWEEIPWELLCLSAFLGLCFNLSLNFGVTFTYPLFISIGAVLIAPANLLIDVFIREFSFTTMQIVGSILSVTALVVLLLPVKEKTKPEEEKKVNLNDYENDFENDNKKDDEILTDL